MNFQHPAVSTDPKDSLGTYIMIFNYMF